MKRRTAYLVVLVFVAVSVGWFAFQATEKLIQNLPPEISRTEFLSEVDQGHVAKIVIADRKFISGVSSTHGAFRTTMPVEGTMVNQLSSRGVVIEFEREATGLE